MKPNRIIAVTMGDPGGIGPEVILKTFQKAKLCPGTEYRIYGTRAPFKKLHACYEKILDRKTPHALVTFVETSPDAGFDPGQVSRRNGMLTLSALSAAANAAVKGQVQALVTAPLNKSAVRLVAPGFHGHTEYLAEKSGTEKFAMMFVSSRLRVTLATIHTPIRKVSALITTANVGEKIALTHDFLRRQMKMPRPKIAVCALNPHGRETGTEEEDEILPACERARAKGMKVFGPLSADQLFYEAYQGRYDAVISMYHDQGLAPFKMMAFHEGVNVTLGLPFVRTSPDHGTAMDIAYQGKAEASSFQEALKLAERLVCRRRG